VSIRIRYFAALAERIGRRTEEIDTAAATAGALVDELRARGEPWASAFDTRTQIAINQHVAGAGDAISDGDEVAFFPPVTGG
jgi:molybdopterin synthase sulfur carrier subunit